MVEAKVMDREPNKRAPGKGGITSLLTSERARPALPEQYLQLFITC